VFFFFFLKHKILLKKTKIRAKPATKEYIKEMTDNGRHSFVAHILDVNNTTPQLLVKKLSATAVIPTRESAGAAGYDISSAYSYVVKARGKELIKTDIAIMLPPGTMGKLTSRSGLSWKNGIEVGAGLIDSDYRAGIGVVLYNHSDKDFIISEGDRIAQLIIQKIEFPDVVEVKELTQTTRGEKGFGSTGVASTPTTTTTTTPPK